MSKDCRFPLFLHHNYQVSLRFFRCSHSEGTFCYSYPKIHTLHQFVKLVRKAPCPRIGNLQNCFILVYGQAYHVVLISYHMILKAWRGNLRTDLTDLDPDIYGENCFPALHLYLLSHTLSHKYYMHTSARSVSTQKMVQNQWQCMWGFERALRKRVPHLFKLGGMDKKWSYPVWHLF